MDETKKIDRNPANLAPFFRRKLNEALRECHASNLLVELFEGYRSPERQSTLYQQGRINKNPKVTNAKAWESYHQYHIAADLAFRPNQIWTWSGPWDKVITIFKSHGFETITWEKSHFHISGGLTPKQCYEIYQTSSMLGVWDAADIMRK